MRAPIREIAHSIARFGVISPIIADDQGRIAAGHARAEAAKLIGLTHYPVIRLPHLSEVEIRAYALADNKIASKAGWDREILAIELGELRLMFPEVNLDLDITGFEAGEINSLMIDFEEGRSAAEDRIPEVARGSQSIWIALAVIALLCITTIGAVYLVCSHYRLTPTKQR